MGTARYLWLIPLFSLGIEVPDDSSETIVGFSAGSGSYSWIARDCSGRATSAKEVPYAAGTISVERRTSAWFYGIKADAMKRRKIRSVDQYAVYNPETQDYDYMTSDHSTGYMVTPFIGSEGRNFGITAGFLLPGDNKVRLGDWDYNGVLPSGKLRIGRLDRIHVEASFAFNSPVVAGGGLVDLGLGLPLAKEGSKLWVGVDAIPYEASGILLKSRFPISDEFFITASARYAQAANVTTEHGWSLGLSYRLRD